MKLFSRFLAPMALSLLFLLSCQILFAQIIPPCEGPLCADVQEAQAPISSVVIILIIAAKGLGIYKYVQLKKRK